MSDKDKTPPSAESGGEVERPPGKAPGKKSRTSALPATGDRTDRLRIERGRYDFGPVEIGSSETQEVRVKNTSKDFLSIEDFWTSLGQSPSSGPRDGSEFTIAGASRDDIAPGGIASLPVTFTPKATYPEDEKEMARRSGHIALLDAEGATAGTIKVRAVVHPPSKEAREAGQVRETLGSARRGAVLQPTSFDEILAQVRAARELFLGSDLDGARDLLTAVLDSWHKHANAAKVGQRFRGYGFSRDHAVTLAGQARDEINKLLMFPTPVGYELAISRTQVAEEVLRVMYGEAKEARGLKALNDASLPALAGDAAEEVGANAKRIVTDAAFAAGFGLGALEGVYDAVRDMVSAIGDAAKLAIDLSQAFLKGGFIGMTLEALDKLDTAASDMAAAIALFGPEIARRWSEGSSYQQGHFRGEVVGYVVAQIAVIILTSGEAAAVQATGKWATVAKALRSVNAMGDITEWAGLLERMKLPPGLAAFRREMTAARNVSSGMDAKAPPHTSNPAPAPIDELTPRMANKGSKLVHTPREQALKELLEEARQGDVVIQSDDEAQRLLDWAARQENVDPSHYHAVTIGDSIFVRPEHASNVRVLREELIHVGQQRRGISTAEIVQGEIEARLLMIRFRHKWGITSDEVREMIQEVRQMRKTGRY